MGLKWEKENRRGGRRREGKERRWRAVLEVRCRLVGPRQGEEESMGARRGEEKCMGGKTERSEKRGGRGDMQGRKGEDEEERISPSPPHLPQERI